MAPVAKKTTLLDLLVKLQEDKPCGERMLVLRAIRALRRGRYVLCGTFGGTSVFK